MHFCALVAYWVYFIIEKENCMQQVAGAVLVISLVCSTAVRMSVP